ncbi:acyltransferase [Candidatus Pelagibacter sp.]|nr:acyltransferase [Candidatus Pelagibacter sp.]
MIGYYRFVLANIVLLFHFFTFEEIGNVFTNYNLGNSAVICFLFISGYYNYFLITDNKTYKTYILDRVLRIFPIYLLSTIILLALIQDKINFGFPLIYEVLLIPKSFEFLFNKNIKSFFFNGVSWSLAVEFLIFIIFPLIIFYVREKYIKFILFVGIIIHSFLLSSSILYLDVFKFIGNETICAERLNLCNAKINYIFGYKSIFPLILIFFWGYYFAKYNFKKNLIFIIPYLLFFIFLTDDFSRIDVFIGIFVFIPITWFISKFKFKIKFDKYFGKISYPIFLIHLPLLYFFDLNFLTSYLLIMFISILLERTQNLIDNYRYELRKKNKPI